MQRDALRIQRGILDETLDRRARTLAGASFLLVGLAVANWPATAHAQTSAGTRAVPTYEAAGLYWSNPGATAATGCEVKYRLVGTSAWKPGLALWFDARDNECRGSLVNLAPDSDYQVELNLPGQAVAKSLTFSTWPNTRPVAKVVTVNSGAATLNITEGGSASTGYVVYQGNGAVLDANNASQFNVSVNASYVIVRGLTLKGAQQDAIRISPNVKDVVIEDNDISGWGRTRDGTWGTDMDSGVRAVCSTPTLERVTIQRNRIHDPRYSANSWSDGHPAGPQAVTISYCGGNHVIRHNDMYSTTGRYFNDVIGGEDNFTDTGFPHSDTDIYANRLSHAWDDAIEAEGANKNVRIWGNYIDSTAIGVATTVTATGPVYIFRNVYNRSRFFEKVAPDQDERQPFFKSGSDASLGNGRRYVFHNTMLQATQAGASYTLGAGAGMGGTGSSQLINNTISKNNIYHLWKPSSAVYQAGTGNTFAHDMYNGSAGTTIANGINATPAYAPGNGAVSEALGQYQLAVGTPGFDGGARIDNFNDAFVGAAPDVGAHEGGSAAMKFGLAAASGGTPPPPPPNAAPTVSTMTPAILVSGPDSAKTFSVLYRDDDGFANVDSAMLLVNSSAVGANAIYAVYKRATHTLSLYNDAMTAIAGSCAPGSAGTLSNSQGSVNCATTTISVAGASLRVNWSITPKAAFAGATNRNVYAKVVDNAGAATGWVDKGNWTITAANTAPTLASLGPTSLSSAAGAAQTLSALYSDADGYGNLDTVMLMVNTAGVNANGIYARYVRSTNTLYLYNDAATAFAGSCTPGASQTISNTRGSLHCAGTSVTYSGGNLRVNWRITPKTAAAGAKNVYMFARDNSGASIGWVDKGNWTIQ